MSFFQTNAITVIVHSTNSFPAFNYHNQLDNHESYILCPDKPAMKLDTRFSVSKLH